VVQIDSLHIDESATASRAAAFHEDFEARAEAEAEVLRQMRARVVVADIPPVACAAADRAGVQSVVLGNFTWDWIYAAYPQFAASAPGVVETIGNSYGRAARALRLPLHGGFETMRTVVRDIPFIARKSRRSRDEVRRALGFSPADCVVLASFGGHQLGLDYGAIARRNPFRLLVTDYEYPRSSDTNGLVCIARQHLADRGLKYEDLIAAADAVVGKPGYGIVSECVANGVAFLYARRSRFAEQDVFEREMPNLLRCRRIEKDDLLTGDWRESIEALLAQPSAPTVAPTDGAETAAAALLELL
jgi:L-arabinokinase